MKMTQGLLTWSPCRQFVSLPITFSLPSKIHFKEATRRYGSISATLEPVTEQPLTAKERRQLRKEKRENSPAYNWREVLEEKLMEKKPKKKHVSWKDALDLNQLALLGPQWWIVKVSAISWEAKIELLTQRLARNFPDMDFKVDAPAVQVKRRLKNGSYSVRAKLLLPNTIFLRCVLNKNIHDFIRKCEGVRGFLGYKVGNAKISILRPKPIAAAEVEHIFQAAKEEQEKIDQAFKEENQGEGALNPEIPNVVDANSQLTSKDVTESIIDSKPKSRSRKTAPLPADNQSKRRDDKLLRVGSTVRVTSGTFAEFAGILKKLERKTRRATIGFTLFGKETLVDLGVDEIVVDT